MLCSEVPPSYLDSCWERPGPPTHSVPLLLSDLDVDVLGKSSCEDWVLLQQKRLNTTIWSHFKDVDTEGRRRPVAQPSLAE